MEITMNLSVVGILLIAIAVICCIVVVNFINMLIAEAFWKKLSNSVIDYLDKIKDMFEDLSI